MIGALAASALALLTACERESSPMEIVAPSSLEDAATVEASAPTASALAPAPPSICVPSPVTPANGATLDNGRTDIMEEILWDFDWSNCAGATLYGIRIERSGGSRIEEEDLTTSSYRYHIESAWFDASRLTGWTWQVRARVDGVWGNWSSPRSFQVEPPNTDPPWYCVPTLVSPASGATLDNGRTDRTNGIVWNFAWSGCAGATHQLRVVRAVFRAIPAIDKDDITASEYRHSMPGTYIASTNLTGWIWQVRALTAGRWGEWSTPRPFRVEAPNTDPPPAGM